MKKKMSPHIIAAGAFVVFIVLGLACATAPSGPKLVKTYEMQIMPSTGISQGKGAVVFDLAMAEKILPKKAIGTNGGGGLVGLAIAAAGNAADLKNFTDAATSVTWLEDENNALSKKQPKLNEDFSTRYNELNNVNTASSSFNFNGVKPTVDYFSKSNADIKAKITAVCAEKKVDYAVTMVGQIVHAETMNAAPISVPTTFIVEVCLFDKVGTLVSQGKVETVTYMTTGRNHMTVFNVLLDDAIENIVLMLPALGGNGNKIGSKEYVEPTIEIDRGDTREAGHEEIVLIVKRKTGFAGSAVPIEITLDKGTDNERMIKISRDGQEIRMVVPNGEHTLVADYFGASRNEKIEPFKFTASSSNLVFTVGIKSKKFIFTKEDK